MRVHGSLEDARQTPRTKRAGLCPLRELQAFLRGGRAVLVGYFEPRFPGLGNWLAFAIIYLAVKMSRFSSGLLSSRIERPPIRQLTTWARILESTLFVAPLRQSRFSMSRKK
jgi:hypothetical protein